MGIDTMYREVLTEDYIKDQLSRGVAITASDVEDEIDTLLDGADLSVPQMTPSNHYVSLLSNSSASGFSATFAAIKQDMRVLYKEMMRLSQVGSDAYERWKIEAEAIEKKLVDLEDRIEDLLLLAQDTEGYFSVIVDNFTDTSMIDLDESSVRLDLDGNLINMAPGAQGATRIFLNNLNDSDLSFKVRSSANFQKRVDTAITTLRDVFSQTSSAWWTSIEMSKVTPVTCELLVRLRPSQTVELSRIFIELHDSSQSSSVNITPLTSVDGYNFIQLPSSTFSQDARTHCTFAFPTVEAQWVKFILTKRGPDPSTAEGAFSYQFGFKQIAFYSEGFDLGTVQELITTPLWVRDKDGNPEEFEKLTLQTCERLETDTKIRYYVMTSNDATVPISSGVWSPISPVNRASPMFPVVLDVGDTVQVDLGDDETVSLSYNGSATSSSYINPAQSFQLLSDDGSGGLDDDTISASAIRYTFKNTNDRILNYQIKDDVELNESTLLLFRNVGEQGLNPETPTHLVRDIQRGWGFSDPYYFCVVEIENPEGLVLDVGDKNIIIDDVTYTGIVDRSVLTGKTATNSGVHRVKVHKNNWKYVTPDLNTLAELKAADPLYPYNHKLLIEGYSYGSSYSATSAQVYTGVDLFAETQMIKIGIFDLMNNAPVDGYQYFALDIDAPASHTGGNTPTTVFVLKVDEDNPDFQNERFVIRFTLINQLRKYLRLKMALSTEDETVCPACHSYRIKLG